MELFLRQNLKALRASKDLNQQEFAALFGLGDSTYGNYETGYTKQPDLLVLKRIADHFGITVDDLLYKQLSGIAKQSRSGSVQSYETADHPAEMLNEPMGEYGLIEHITAIAKLYKRELDELKKRLSKLEEVVGALSSRKK